MISRLTERRETSPLRSGLVLLASFVLGVLSHGVLDGLLHQYPIPRMIDPPAAVAGIALWCALVQSRFRLLFIVTFLGAILPDLIDLSSAIANRLFQLRLPTLAESLGFHLPAGHFFPWHWPEGSGSIFDGTRDAVSLTNHIIVMSFVTAAVWTNRGILIWVSNSKENKAALSNND